MKVLITGDFCPRNRLEKAIRESEPSAILLGMMHFLKNADLAITNLECPITDAKYPISKTGPSLKTSEDTATFLKKAGFGIVTLANNHIMDYGKKGLEHTFTALKKEGVNWVGAGSNFNEAQNPYFFEKKGKRLALLNFSENEWSTTHGTQPGANPITAVENFRSIKEAKSQADQVIVLTHGGHEMYRLPSPRMKQLFRFYIEAGAGVVINHHPHCTSGFEIYRGAPIFFSLGNFLFDHPTNRHNIWNKGIAIELTFLKEKPTYQIIHFDQCNDQPVLNICSEEECRIRDNEILKLNEIIKSDHALQLAFKEWVSSGKAKMYRAFIEPHRNKYIQALQNRGWLPSMWSTRKKLYLLNLIRCEAHRDVLQLLLEDDLSHS